MLTETSIIAGLIGSGATGAASLAFLRPRRRDLLAAAEGKATEAATRAVGALERSLTRLEDEIAFERQRRDRCEARLDELTAMLRAPAPTSTHTVQTIVHDETPAPTYPQVDRRAPTQ